MSFPTNLFNVDSCKMAPLWLPRFTPASVSAFSVSPSSGVMATSTPLSKIFFVLVHRGWQCSNGSRSFVGRNSEPYCRFVLGCVAGNIASRSKLWDDRIAVLCAAASFVCWD